MGKKGESQSRKKYSALTSENRCFVCWSEDRVRVPMLCWLLDKDWTTYIKRQIAIRKAEARKIRSLLFYCLFVVFNFSTHGHIPTARSGPSLTAAVSALPLPQPSSPPATGGFMWAPDRPPPSWGPSVQQIGIWAIGPARALERPHRDSTPTSDFCGTNVKPPQRVSSK